jgi:hypothetical protein
MSATEPLGVALLLAAGSVAGFLNTVAGGGSMLTVPALMWLGLPADIANGTSRVSVLAQGVAATWGFRRSGSLDSALLAKLSAPIVLGAVVGAYAATLIPNAIFKPLLLATFILMAFATLLKPSTFAPPPGEDVVLPSARKGTWLALLLAGFYGGFLQAGVGFVLLAVFASMLRIDLVRGNALKVATVLAYSGLVVLVFASRARIEWISGLVLSFGNVIGAALGVRFAVRRGQDAIKKVVVLMIVASCVSLLFKP